MKRTLVAAFLFSLVAASAFAYNPSARYETRMVFDPQLSHMILFGGITGTDSGTAKAYRLGDTWEWTGSRWIQRFPETSPEARNAHVMVYDSARSRVLLFGGRGDAGDLNDTWTYVDRKWTQILTPNSPPARALPGGAYDPVRDRFVIFGGTATSADGKTLTPLYDTWEFDGTTWTQAAAAGPAVTKPILAYDAARNQIIMLGLDATTNTVMYTYDPSTSTWNQVKPATLPSCVNEGQMAYQSANQTVVYTGGVCANAEGEGVDTTYEWDGTTWNKITTILQDTRVFGAAFAYDDLRQQATLFGGTPIIGTPLLDTWIYASGNWFSLSDATYPAPRALYAFASDPVNNTIWMYGGTDQFTTYSDFWQFQNGQWTQIFNATTPASCVTPNAVWDTDRNKLVMVCATSDVFEWDGSTWTGHTGLKTVPPVHNWASMSYDPTLKKTVLFGGFTGESTDCCYLDQTWLWDGASWSRQKNHPAPARIKAAMWYDPTLKKDVIYGGVGRVTSNDRVTRYSDMWSFDGSGWTQITPNGGTPGPRYGAQTVVDPHTNKLLLFGGIFDTVTPPVPPATTNTEVQSYVNDMWEWDGTSWTQLHPATTPSPRENARIAYDPTRDNLVLFGGYGGTFFSDTWTWDGSDWKVMIFEPLGGRRRVTGR